MVNGSILPFQPVSGVDAARRPVPSAAAGDDFAGAMDDALDTRGARRADSAKAPRRADPARPRETAAHKATTHMRKAGTSEKGVSAKKADRPDDSDDKNVERDDEPSNDGCAVPDSPAQPVEPAKTAADATEPGEASAEEAQNADVAVEIAAAAPDAQAVTGDAADDDAAMVPGDMARGRRWDGSTEPSTGEAGKAARAGVARAVAGAASKGAHSGQPATRQQIQIGAPSGTPLAEALHQVESAAAAEPSAKPAASEGVVTQAVETATTKPQTPSAADATTAIENAVANVESTAVAETSAGGDATEPDTRDQAPKPQAAGPQLNAGEAVPAGGPSDGVRFTVNGAAGNAAYANAAPRHEEAVLPQIVQSIRLHAVQGTTEARVQLKPEHLGALNITLKVEQNQVTATIQADVAAVRAWIESHESSLRQALSEQGLQLARLVVQEDGQQASKDEQQGERPRRQPRRRSWRDEEATFEVLV